jgi:hypothetical protein
VAQLRKISFGEQAELAAGCLAGANREAAVRCRDAEEAAVSESDEALELGKALLLRTNSDATARKDPSLPTGICGMRLGQATFEPARPYVGPFLDPPFI